MNRVLHGRGLILLMFLTFTTLGCDSFKHRSDVSNTNYVASEAFLFEVPVADQRAIRLEGINGSVLLRGRKITDAVRIEGEKRVGSESQEDANNYLSRLNVEVYDQQEYVLIRTDQPEENRGRLLEVNYIITFPDTLSIDITAVNGDMELDTLHSDLVISHVNGNITLAFVDGNASVSLVNGTINSYMVLPGGGILSNAVVNGNIVLHLPDSTSANLSASLTNGQIYWSGLTINDAIQTSTQLTGTLGDGDGQIRLQSVNGTINITGHKN